MIQLLAHQPIDFSYNLNTCEVLSNNCLQYQTSDVAMFQFKNTDPSCTFFIGIRPPGSTSAPVEINYENYVISGEFITVSVDFTALGLSEGCYEIALYEVCTDTENNLVENGTFATDLSGWTTADGLTLDVDSHTSSSVTLIASGGTGSLEYNIDGGSYQGSTTFSGLTPLVPYTFCVRDDNNIKTCAVYTIIECGSLGCLEYDYLPYGESSFLECLEYDSLCKYGAVITNTNALTLDGSFSSTSLFPSGKIIAVVDDLTYNGLYEILSASLTGFGGNTLVLVLTTSPFDPGDIGNTLTVAR